MANPSRNPSLEKLSPIDLIPSAWGHRRDSAWKACNSILPSGVWIVHDTEELDTLGIWFLGNMRLITGGFQWLNIYLRRIWKIFPSLQNPNFCRYIREYVFGHIFCKHLRQQAREDKQTNTWKAYAHFILFFSQWFGCFQGQHAFPCLHFLKRSSSDEKWPEWFPPCWLWLEHRTSVSVPCWW